MIDNFLDKIKAMSTEAKITLAIIITSIFLYGVYNLGILFGRLLANIFYG